MFSDEVHSAGDSFGVCVRVSLVFHVSTTTGRYHAVLDIVDGNSLPEVDFAAYIDAVDCNGRVVDVGLCDETAGAMKQRLAKSLVYRRNRLKHLKALKRISFCMTPTETMRCC